MKKTIDVSEYQGVIDWDAVKADGVEFAIIRGGLGDDVKSQDDKQFGRNWVECQRVGIPCTMYFFTYAAAADKGGDISSELAHIKRLLHGKTMNCTAPIYIDVENDPPYLNWRSISNAAMLDIFKKYKAGLAELGYKMGIYSSRSAFWNEKMAGSWYENNVSIWVAEPGSLNNWTRPRDLWQYGKTTGISGIKGECDINWLYADFSLPAPEPVPVPADGILRGDVNGDGKVNAMDVIRLKKHLANKDYETGKSTVKVAPGADVNGDGKINAQDVIALKKKLANKDY